MACKIANTRIKTFVCSRVFCTTVIHYLLAASAPLHYHQNQLQKNHHLTNMASLLTNAQNAYSKKDNSTLSNAASVRCLSVHLEWRLDFLNSQIHGSATHAMEILVAGTETAIFDSRVLTIKGVEIDGKTTTFTVGEENAALGSCITVVIPENLRAQGSKFQISFQYSTSKEAPAIQW